MSPLHLILAAAAVWRITHLFQVEDGPFATFERLRGWLRRNSLAGAVDCFYCLSLWVAAPIAFMLAHSVKEAVVATFALSAFAILMERLVVPAESKAIYFEQPEEKMLCPAAETQEKLVPQPRESLPELSR